MSAVPATVRSAPRPERAPQRRATLRVVPEPRTRHPLLFALLLLATAAVTVFLAVTLNALAAGDAIDSVGLERDMVAAERANAALVVEVARLEDPARIRLQAQEMGMVEAGAPRYLVPGQSLPVDATTDQSVVAGQSPDPLKPLLSVER